MVARGYCNTVEYHQIPPNTAWELALRPIYTMCFCRMQPPYDTLIQHILGHDCRKVLEHVLKSYDFFSCRKEVACNKIVPCKLAFKMLAYVVVIIVSNVKESHAARTDYHMRNSIHTSLALHMQERDIITRL